MGLKRTHFTTTEDLKFNVIAELLKNAKEAFAWCFQ
jgi:hypothetical protein